MRRRVPWLAVLAVAAGLYLMLAILWVGSQPDSLGFDILLVRSAGERLLAGQPIYPDPGAASFLDPGPDDFYGPPALAVAAALIAQVPSPLVRAGAFPISWLVFIVGLGALVSSARLGHEQAAGVFIGAMLAFAVFWGATLGASSVWLFGLLAGAIVALTKRWDVAAGLLVGTAAALRIYPIVLLVPLLIAGRWRAAGATVAAALAWIAVGLIAAGPEATRTFLELLAALGGVEAGSSNIALGGALRLVSISGGIALLVGAGLLARRAESAGVEVLVWGLALGGMLLVTPVVWDHYTTALLPLVVAIVALTGLPVAGLLAVAMLPASVAGGLVIVWLPLLAAAVLWGRRGGSQ
jgi:alpha-1,2-mannosyltransferase